MSDTSTYRWPEGTIANVSWNTATPPPLDGIDAATALLARMMREDHPGVKYRVVRQTSPDAAVEGLLAVPLDG